MFSLGIVEQYPFSLANSVFAFTAFFNIFLFQYLCLAEVTVDHYRQRSSHYSTFIYMILDLLYMTRASCASSAHEIFSMVI